MTTTHANGLPAGKTADEIRANCALEGGCQCVLERKPWACPNWGRSSLPCPSVVSAYTQTITVRGPMANREELRRAGERSILNRRNYSDKPQPGDRDPKHIREEAQGKARKRREMGARKYLETL